MSEGKFSQLIEIKPHTKSIPVAAQSKAWVCGHSLTGTGVSNPAGAMDIRLLLILCVVRKRSLLWAVPSPEISTGCGV